MCPSIITTMEKLNAGDLERAGISVQTDESDTVDFPEPDPDDDVEWEDKHSCGVDEELYDWEVEPVFGLKSLLDRRFNLIRRLGETMDSGIKRANKAGHRDKASIDQWLRTNRKYAQDIESLRSQYMEQLSPFQHLDLNSLPWLSIDKIVGLVKAEKRYLWYKRASHKRISMGYESRRKQYLKTLSDLSDQYHLSLVQLCNGSEEVANLKIDYDKKVEKLCDENSYDTVSLSRSIQQLWKIYQSKLLLLVEKSGGNIKDAKKTRSEYQKSVRAARKEYGRGNSKITSDSQTRIHNVHNHCFKPYEEYDMKALLYVKGQIEEILSENESHYWVALAAGLGIRALFYGDNIGNDKGLLDFLYKVKGAEKMAASMVKAIPFGVSKNYQEVRKSARKTMRSSSSSEYIVDHASAGDLLTNILIDYIAVKLIEAKILTVVSPFPKIAINKRWVPKAVIEAKTGIYDSIQVSGSFLAQAIQYKQEP